MSFLKTLSEPRHLIAAEPRVGAGDPLWHALEGLDQGILVYDRALTVLAFNRRAIEILDLPLDDFQVGGSFVDWVRRTAENGGYGGEGPVEDRIAHRLSIARSFKPLHTDQTRANGQVIELRGKPIPGGYVTTYTDVTDRKRAELALLSLAEKEAELSNRLANEIAVKNRLFSIIAHDLRSPFTSLLGRTEMMALTGPDASREKLLQQTAEIGHSARQAFRLVENLLEWARTQLRGECFQPVSISLDDAIEASLDELQPVARAKAIVLEHRQAEVTAYADVNMLHTVLRNLIGNAVKFTPPGGHVTVMACYRAGMAEISVADTGTGVAPGMLPDLFNVDVKTTTAGTAGEMGTGLGLPVCAELLARNKGRIWVENGEGRGAVFRFSLPVTRP